MDKLDIFDVSRIVDSTLTQLTQQNVSPVTYFKLDSYYRYYDGSTYVTGSRIESALYKAIDGYKIFPEQIGSEINTSTPFWPIMTDGPATQSVMADNDGRMAVYSGYLGATPGLVADRLIYSGSNGSTYSYVIATANSTNTNEQITSFPMAYART